MENDQGTQPEMSRSVQIGDMTSRQDLADSFGLVLTMPPGAVDVAGTWRYGILGPPTALSSETSDTFTREMIQLFQDQQYSLTEQEILAEESLTNVRISYYQIGPASESWPSYFFDIYSHARPFLGDGADLLAWGYFFRGVLEGIKHWASAKNDQWPGEESILVSGWEEVSPPSQKWEPVSINPVLTRMAVVSLCFQHAIDKYGLGGTVAIDTFPRGWYYGDVHHPQGWESYLVRIVAGSRQFYYQLTGTGLVQQHFLLTDGDVTLLDIPDFGHPNHREGQRALSTDRIDVTIS